MEENKDLSFTEEDLKIFQKLMERLQKESSESDVVFQSILNEMSDYFANLHKRMQQQYILSCKGDLETIVNDIKYTLTQITKKDFQKTIKDRREMLPTKEFLLKRYEGIPEPERSELINQIPEVILMTKKETVGNFQNAYKYIIYTLRTNIAALEYYDLPADFVSELAEEKAAQWYKKPQNHKNVISHIDKSLEQAKRPFFDMPNSPASHLLFSILASGEGISDLPSRKKQVSHGTRYEVKANGDKRQVSMENCQGTAKVTVELADINKLNKAGKKLLILSMIKANEQSLYKGELTKDYISFPLKELVDYGLYSSLNGARKGFEIGTDALTSIKVKGTVRKTQKSSVTIHALEVPFTGAKITNNQCFIYLNNRIDWKFLAQYFTKLPKYYFKLSNRASDLLYYIFYLARQHTAEIAERGYFAVSFQAIHSLLQLPDPKTSRNPQRDIKDVIENAIADIQTEQSTMYGNAELSFELVYDEKMGISEYLDNGYLRISFNGTFAESFVSHNDKKTDKIDQEEQTKTRIEEKSKAVKRAKSIAKGKKTGA